MAAGRFPLRRVPGYVGAQLRRRRRGQWIIATHVPDHPTLGATLPRAGAGQSFVLEIVLTLMLMFVILSVSTGAKEKGVLAGVAIGAVIALEALFAGPISGASMNPARSLAPALIAGRLDAVWVYLTAPFLGALLGGGRLSLRATTGLLQRERGHVMKRLLFVCIENSNRSQMAEAFARMLGGPAVEAYSAGSKPSGRVNPKAIAAMAELGYDLTTHTSKGLADLPPGLFDVAVTMGCGDACPLTLAKRHIDWQIPDPRELGPDEFRGVRDLIQSQVRELLQTI